MSEKFEPSDQFCDAVGRARRSFEEITHNASEGRIGVAFERLDATFRALGEVAQELRKSNDPAAREFFAGFDAAERVLNLPLPKHP